MGVIHRDIKPANLMITAAGMLKIMDFGIARVRGSQLLTLDGSMVGTLAYMAPEQLRGESGDERSDLYSLAIVLYELLTGSTPFVADSDYDLMQAQIHARPQRLVGRVPGLDGRVEAVLMRALAKKADQRFASVREFSDALGATALRMDAPTMVLEGTRLMTRPQGTELERAASSGSFDRVFDRLPWVPAGLRMPLMVGVSTFVVAGVLVMGALALMPSPVADVPAKTTFAAAGTKKLAPAPEPPAERASVQTAAKSEPRPQPPPSGPSAGAASAPLNDKDPRVEQRPASTPGEKPTGPPEARPSGDFKTALARKSYAEAFELARPAADGGDRDAQFAVAFLYDSGKGVDRDEEKAAAWYQKAAEQGHPLAQLNLGDMYAYGGGGLQQSLEQAFNWYRKAAEQGNADAQNNVGIAYVAASGTARDDFAAVVWFEKAAKQNYAKALKNLGDMYANGRGVGRKDQQEALRYYYQAAEQNHAGAEYNIGVWYENGFGGQQRDYQKAAQWYARAAEHGHAQARAALDALRSQGDQGRTRE
jgi:serine/threonine-protein kinase